MVKPAPTAVQESESTVTLPGADENYSSDELSSPPPPGYPATEPSQPASGSSYQQPEQRQRAAAAPIATFEDFEKLDLRVGRVLEVESFPEARNPAWKLRIDFGPELGEKRSSAQITHYPAEELEGRLVVGVVNFPPRRIAGFKSEVLVLGALDDEHGVVLLRPDRDDVAPGDRIG